MDDDSLVSLRKLGCGHIDMRRLRKRTQGVGNFILAIGELETYGVPESELGHNGLNREVIARLARGNAGSKKRYSGSGLKSGLRSSIVTSLVVTPLRGGERSRATARKGKTSTRIFSLVSLCLSVFTSASSHYLSHPSHHP
jgi:hypothetical protein